MGIGKKAYWTGSTRTSTLLGLDIDDHDSTGEDEIRHNAEASLALFAEVTGLKPIPCKVWHKLVQAVDAERCRRGLVAKLEPKGHARVFEAEKKYCGVLFKDPLWNCNPTDRELHSFWVGVESNSISGPQLIELLSTVLNLVVPETVTNDASSKTSVTACDDLLPVFTGQWAKMCRHWAIHGLLSEDSIYQVVHELALWLYFVELFEVEELDRSEQVATLLIHFVCKKHNGCVTRINDGQIEEVKNHIFRIVKSTVDNCSENAKAVFAILRQKRSAGQYSETWLLAPLMQDCEASTTHSTALSPVRFTHCCTVSKTWLPKPEYWRQKAEQWNPILDESPLPNQLEAGIRRYYRRHGLRIKKPTIVKIRQFLNHISACSGEARLGIESLKKLGFTGHHSRRHIKHLEDMGVIRTVAHSKSIGLSKGFVLLPPYKEMLDEAKNPTTDDCAS